MRVDTFHVALLGFSLISIIVFTYTLGYFLVYSAVDSQELPSGIFSEDPFVIEATKTVAFYMFILPQIISLMLWYVMPSFIKDWYALEPLPPAYRHIRVTVEKMASRMGISPPHILYSRRNIANCFNLGKREGESTVVISEWLVRYLNQGELEAVLSHEMAHTKNRDVTLMAYFAAVKWTVLLSPLFVYCGISSVFQFDSSIDFLFYSEFWIIVIPFFLLYLVLFLGIQWFSRVREAAADAQASLFAGREILKKTIYTLSCAKSMRLAFVPSCLMTCGGSFGGILFTHPPLNKRLEMLEKTKYIQNTTNPPSLKSVLTSSLSLFMFIQLVNLFVSALHVIITGSPSQVMPLLFLNPIITAVLLVLYYDYVTLKYYGVIIFFVSSLHVILPLALIIIISLLAQYIYPFSDGFSTETKDLILYIAYLGKDLWKTTGFLLKGAVRFFVISFLIAVLLNYSKKYFHVLSIAQK